MRDCSGQGGEEGGEVEGVHDGRFEGMVRGAVKERVEALLKKMWSGGMKERDLVWISDGIGRW